MAGIMLCPVLRTLVWRLWTMDNVKYFDQNIQDSASHRTYYRNTWEWKCTNYINCMIVRFLHVYMCLLLTTLFAYLHSVISWTDVYLSSLKNRDIQLRSPLQAEISKSSIRTWISNHIYEQYWDIIIHPCGRLNGGLGIEFNIKQ